MPRVAELRQVDGVVWARLEMPTDEGCVTFWTNAEIAKFRHDCVRDFLTDLLDQCKQWEERQT